MGSVLNAQPPHKRRSLQTSSPEFWFVFVHNDADVARLGLGIMYPGVRQNWGHAMKARKLLEDAALGPDQLAVLYQAFDEAWEVLKPHYRSDSQST
jgi:hypothetical protein